MNVALNERVIKEYFSYLSTKTYVLGSQKNCLSDGSFEHPKQMFKLMDKKIFFNFTLNGPIAYDKQLS